MTFLGAPVQPYPYQLPRDGNRNTDIGSWGKGGFAMLCRGWNMGIDLVVQRDILAIAQLRHLHKMKKGRAIS